jgi:2-methylcitrate dehydratase PrpD
MTPGESATEALARFAVGIRYDALPQPVISRLRECFLDFVGISAFAAVHAETSAAFRSAIQALGPAGSSTVIGESRGYTYPYAALLNGTFAHTLDFDDTNLYGSLHPGAPVIAAAMAIAETANASGREFIEALAAGYEVTCRVGAALGPTAYDRGFHITAVAGIFGAVAAAAKLRKVSVDVAINAFGIAGSQAAGSMQYLDNGAWNKRLHPGFAAHDALTSLAFAQTGVLGASSPIEGRYGLLNGYSNSPRPELLSEELGARWALVETAIKPYPSCRFTHAAIDATLALRERFPPDGRATASLRVRLSPKAVQIVGERLPNKLRPQNIVDGQFSVYFQTATAWVDGSCDWQSYERLRAPELEALAERIHVEADPAIPFAGAEVSIECGGRTLVERFDEPLGEPQRPLSWEQVERKFLTMAGPVYGIPAAQALARRIRRLEEEPSSAQLIQCFRAGSTS